VAGGWAGASCLTSVEIFDPLTNTWSDAAPLPVPRAFHTATLLPDGRVLIAGGRSNGTPGYDLYLSSTVIYDPETGIWSDGPELAAARMRHSATLLPDGRVLVVGGYAANWLASSEVLDPFTEKWAATEPLAAERGDHSATLLPSGKVLVTGGHGSIDSASAVELYDPTTGAWTAMPQLLAARNSHRDTAS
jgi:N-acetylneuraminic acid mutarotase